MLDKYGAKNPAEFPHRLERAIYRVKKSGRVTYHQADEICIALGYHPPEIYGEAWWA